MAVFVAASDETAGADHRSRFLYSGFLAPEKDWSGAFAEQWDKRVLEGPPRIPYLHMTDIRDKDWCEEYGLTRKQADHRVREAFGVISEVPSLTPIGSSLNAGHLLDTFTKKVKLESGALKKFAPDYLAFASYVYLVLLFCHARRPEAEKVDFIVEKNGEITDHIQQFYRDVPRSLTNLNLPHLVPMLGELIPAGKDCVPLQAADVLCWYTQRFGNKALDDKNVRRYKVIGKRKGARWTIKDDDITALWTAIIDDKEN